ncbi:MAG: M20/M25/M40 family metallo-hydrolase [Candidatus Jorgensenbacteria bacterium]
MLKKILPLAKKLISMKSTPDDREALEKALNLALSDLKGYTVEKFERRGVKSALIYNTPKRPKKFKVILNGHLDVIPGKENQYLPRIKGNRLYGVGSMDMKANVACLIAVFKEVVKKIDYPLGLQLVTDEEVGGFDGTKYQIEKGVGAEFVIAAESTDFNIKNKAKGILWAKVSAKGKTAHGAYPWRGENAIWKISEFLKNLESHYPVPEKEKWVTTVNVAKIGTNNKAFNKIPDDCEVWLDVRYVPEEGGEIVGNLKKILPKGLKLEVLVKEPALATDAKNPYLRLLKKKTEELTKKRVNVLSANGSSDARHFTLVGCPGVEFGPVGGGIASDEEWVDIPSLEKYSRILADFLVSLSISPKVR